MRWKGKNLRPYGPILKKTHQFNYEQSLKPLGEKLHEVPVWNTIIANVYKEPEQPIPVTPSVTPSNTPSTTPTGTPTNTPTQTQTNTPTQTATGTPTPTPSAIPSGTTEANAYLSTVVLSGGTVSAPASAVTVTFFTSLVSYISSLELSSLLSLRSIKVIFRI